ncbi:YdcH family protein [Rickettsiales bacterium]|nr:YdcH family protein [Rickettsiales bacterium]
MGEEEKVQTKLLELDKEHKDLDKKITELTKQGVFDQLLVQRLKRRKLTLKDLMADLRQSLCDDIIA